MNYTQEMKDWFETRTKNHIQLVQKYCVKIYNTDKAKYNLLPYQSIVHDKSKFEEPEMTPYIFITHKYFCSYNNMKFESTPELEEDMVKATEHHIIFNKHHPEAWSTKKSNLISKTDRDSAEVELVDATKMLDIYIAEMVADWCAVSEERHTLPLEWAGLIINKRWKFTKDQEVLILDLIDKAWEIGSENT